MGAGGPTTWAIFPAIPGTLVGILVRSGGARVATVTQIRKVKLQMAAQLAVLQPQTPQVASLLF